MLLKQLSDEDKRTFLCLAELLILCDRPVLWDGGRRVATAETIHYSSVAIQREEREAASFEELASIAKDRGGVRLPFGLGASRAKVESDLIERIRKLSPLSEDDPAARWNVVRDMLRDMLKGKQAIMPSVPKLFLFELMMLSLSGGSISSVRWHLLDDIRAHYHVEPFIFSDLLARAQSVHLETQKTVAIILE
ncbi:MAG: hypothetical protein P4M06_07415 [Pandoraea sp.]|nr:hypothetical protein [Pandoraea sp.]MDR3397376.1 hypothetical protein [Pandoraea sp.]